MTPEIHDILTNKEVITIDQDARGEEARRIRKDGDLEVWSRTLADGGRAVVLFNRGTNEAPIQVSWLEIGFPAHLKASVRDLWQHKDFGDFTGTFSASVPSHAVVMVIIKP